jgi:hypothetical protein
MRDPQKSRIVNLINNMIKNKKIFMIKKPSAEGADTPPN